MPTSPQQQHHHHISSRSQTRVALLKLGSIIPPSSTNLQIKLVEPILYFRGNAEESVGCFLRGDLILNLTKPTKIRKIEMKFAGRMKTFWPEGKLHYGSGANRNELCEEQEIISNSWTVVSSPTLSSGTSLPPPPSSSPSSSHRFSILRSSSSPSSTSRFHLIPAGTHKYPFELFVPGNLPETVEAERGTVHYKLSATAVRSRLSSNLHVSQHVPIIRTVLEERNSEGIAIANEWDDQLDYEITIPKKAYPIGDSIEIDLKLSPRAKKIKVAGVKIQIDEQSLYESKGQKNVESRTLSVYKVDDFIEQRMMLNKNGGWIDNPYEGEEDLGNSFYRENILFPIPKCTTPIHCSCETTSIKISHRLRFIFMIKPPLTVNDDKKKKKNIEFKVDVPITILSCICEDDLPQYEDGDYVESRPCSEGGNPSSRTEGHGHRNSPSYEFPPSYEQSTDYLRRQTSQEIIINTITTQTALERSFTF